MQIFIGLGAGLKWIIRLVLAIFYGVAAYLHLNGQPLLGWLASDHPNITLFLIFLTCFAFLPIFVSIKKQVDGGEEKMRKTTWFLVFVIALLIVCVGYYAHKDFRIGMDNSVLGPASVGINGFLTLIYQSPFWHTYIAPTRWAALWGGVITLAIVIAFVKFKSKITAKVPKPKIVQKITEPISSFSYAQEPRSTGVVAKAPNPQPSESTQVGKTVEVEKTVEEET